MDIVVRQARCPDKGFQLQQGQQQDPPQPTGERGQPVGVDFSPFHETEQYNRRDIVDSLAERISAARFKIVNPTAAKKYIYPTAPCLVQLKNMTFSNPPDQDTCLGLKINARQ